MGQLRWTDDLQGVEEEPDRIQPAQFGDAALEDRLRRRDVQRGMFAGRIAPTRALAKRTEEETYTTLEERGIPHRYSPEMMSALGRAGIPAPADNTVWTKYGAHGFFNRDEMTSAQNFVIKDRVEEIKADPSLAQHPRFPAGHELPHFAVVPRQPDRPRGFEAILMNGNHRVAAELDKGALFIEGRAIVAGDREINEQVLDYPNVRNARASRLAWSHTPHPPKVALKNPLAARR